MSVWFNKQLQSLFDTTVTLSLSVDLRCVLAGIMTDLGGRLPAEASALRFISDWTVELDTHTIALIHINFEVQLSPWMLCVLVHVYTCIPLHFASGNVNLVCTHTHTQSFNAIWCV